MKIELLREVASTNDYIKRYLEWGENVIVCAERQTDGRGTKGRSFSSRAGGVYLSALTFYQNLPASEAFRIMTHSAVAVCRTARKFGVQAQIKWANDVFAESKKLCGILIENGFSGNSVAWSIVGIGLNVNNDLSDLNGIATSLCECAGRKIELPSVRDELIANLQREDGFEDYLSFVTFLGREIWVTERERRYPALARRILRDGRLEIEEAGTIRALSAAEISVKLPERAEEKI